MFSGILKYFFTYIFRNKTRQKLIFFSIIGLTISSFSLVVLQGVMGGLQHGLVTRSKLVLGEAYIDVTSLQAQEISKLRTLLTKKSFNFVPELELELMVQHENYLAPMILHGMDFTYYVPPFLRHKDKTGLIIGGDLGRNLRSFFGSDILITSPAHTQILMEEIPRYAKSLITDFYSSELPEIDALHGWIRIGFVQNLIRQMKVNRLRFYSPKLSLLKKLAKENDLKLITWEDEHSTLVFALGLETKVLLLLFIGASLLIGVCISSGFMIFYNKIKTDLAAFWILGLSRAKTLSLVYIFSQFITVIFCLLGVSLGLGFLYLLQTNQFILMPDHFVERNIPVKTEVSHVILAFFVPYIVSLSFTYFTFKTFKKENQSFISLIK